MAEPIPEAENEPNQIYRNQGGDLQLAWTSPETDNTSGLAWADWDNDGDLDLAVGNVREPNRVYTNNNGTLESAWLSQDAYDTRDVAWGDWNMDGNYDLAAANFGKENLIYQNFDGSFVSSTAFADGDDSTGVAWGDWDADGDLEIAVGNRGQKNRIYDNVSDQPIAIWESPQAHDSLNIDWADWDNDGDDDLLVANFGQPNKIHVSNPGSSPETISFLDNSSNNFSNDVAWGDWDGDGDLDIATAKERQTNLIFKNRIEPFAIKASTEQKNSRSVAWGDWDGDEDLDLAVANYGQPDVIYRNDGGTIEAVQLSNSAENSTSIAWGDCNNDGVLDIAVGNSGSPNHVYKSEGSSFLLVWSSEESNTASIAWGDWDGDGDLDLAIANIDQPNQIYSNSGQCTFSLDWSSNDSNRTRDLAWGDWDSDGDLDLAFANGSWQGERVQIYENKSGSLELIWESELGKFSSVAWGDWNNDGDLDLAAGGQTDRPNKVYDNENGNFVVRWQSTESEDTRSVAWGDWNGDGLLDLAAGNSDTASRLYLNTGDGLELAWSSPERHEGHEVAWGDWNRDGDLDLAIATGEGQSNPIYENRGIRSKQSIPYAVIKLPFGRVAPSFASARIVSQEKVELSYQLYSKSTQRVRFVKGWYSLDNGSTWREALAGDGSDRENLLASPSGTSYQYVWNVFDSEAFGASDSVLFRLDVYPTLDEIDTFQYPFRSARTTPFRLRGNQIRVVDETAQPVANASVHRLPVDQPLPFQPYQDVKGQDYSTTDLGYLQGYGEIQQGDRLLAMVPVQSTETYTLYHTSAPPTTSGLDTFAVSAGGIQQLEVSPSNPLLLFNLTISLEWDARNDSSFLAQLESDLRRTSQIFYDLSNGQAALGEIRIHQNKAFWGVADIVIHAGNAQRPSAILGGSVMTATADIDVNGNSLPEAYVPGQIRIGPTWNRFGNPDGTLGEDWPRVLAHELVHYLFFVPDNYIGVPDNRLRLIDCQGSAMTDPYSEHYSELLTRGEWAGDCLDTVQQRYLGRADWETVTNFYPMLKSTINPGPNQFPLATTEIKFVDPEDNANAIAAPFFNLVDESNAPLVVANGRGQAYLIKTRANNDPTDDYIAALGSPIGDRVHARGAEPGDRLCMLDYSQQPIRYGCQPIGATAAPLTLYDTPDWSPQIEVTGVASDTVTVTVSNTSEDNLHVQLLPALGRASSEVAMQRNDAEFTQTVSAPDGAFYGHVRIWAPNRNKEMIVEYSAIEAWKGRAYAWGGRAYAWGGRAYAWGGRAYAWGAPVISNDGQVSIFSLENLFGNNSDYTLQQMAFAPELPSWLTPAGQTYRISSDGPLPESAILFRYLARDVPDGHEDNLSIYYSPDEGLTWQRLETELDSYNNHASALVQGAGIYALIATVEVPRFAQGWNSFSYSVSVARPPSAALKSIEGEYSILYHFNTSAQQWQSYDPAVTAPFQSLVNTLQQLRNGRIYSIYALQETTLYLDVSDEVVASSADNLSNTSSPPAIYYGWIEPSDEFSPAAGTSIFAKVDETICGESEVIEVEGKLAYVVQVAANSESSPNCGVTGKNVAIVIDGYTSTDADQWNNMQAHFRSLEFSQTPVIPNPPTPDPPTPDPPTPGEDPTDDQSVDGIYLPLVQR